MTAAHLNSVKDRAVDRQARVDWKDPKKKEWHSCGNVTMAEAAARYAKWLHDAGKFGITEDLPDMVIIYVRDMDNPDVEFPHRVKMEVTFNILPIRCKEVKEAK